MGKYMAIVGLVCGILMGFCSIYGEFGWAAATLFIEFIVLFVLEYVEVKK